MKTTFLLIISVVFLSLGSGILAQEIELPNPGLTPDSPFYFLETIIEEIVTFFTFGDLRKAERYAAQAAERLAEAQAIAGKGKPELIEKTLARYEMQLQNSIARAEKAEDEGKNTEQVMARVGKATSKHLEVLAEVYEKVSEEAKPAIENAMKASIKGHEKAVEILKTKGVLGEVPEEAPLSTKVPVEVRERIQARVKQELEVEKILEGLDPSISLRALCTEQGGPPEVCEQLSDESFETFEQIEAFCIEQGGPPETCASVEAQCKEYGVTTPGECFLLMMTATTYTMETHTAPELETAPQGRDSDCSPGYTSQITYGQTKYCCDDSDRSSPFSLRHYYMKGTVKCEVVDTTDGTLISHEINTDSCDGDRLTEWICDSSNKASSEEYDCPKGCQDGACKGLNEIMEAEMNQE